MHGKTTEITHDGEGIFAGLPDPLPSARYHSLVVDPDLPDDLEATAHGGGVLMAMRHRSCPRSASSSTPSPCSRPTASNCWRTSLPNPVITKAMDALMSRNDLASDQTAAVLAEIMDGNASEVETAGVLVALRTKGETVDELVGLARRCARSPCR